MRRRLFRIPGGDEEGERLREEVDEEIRFHLERRVERLVAAGWDREAAEREARRRFGDVDEVREATETMAKRAVGRRRRAGWWRGIREDAAYAVRQLRRSPAFTLVALLTVALGIGVNTAIFSVVDGVLFRPLPYPEPEELVVLWSDVTRRGGPDDEWLSWANFRDLRDRAESLEAAAVWGGWGPPWTDPDEPRQLLGAFVSRGMFDRVLGVEPAMGRTFLAEEHVPGAPNRLLVSHAFWTGALGADPDVVGRTLTLMDVSWEVVGVLPEGFRPPFVPDAEVWANLAPGPDAEERRGGFSWRAVARLAEGTSLEAARAEVAQLGRRLEARWPESNTGMGFRLVPLQDDLVGEARSGLLVLLGAVGLVLLVACVNVANLLLARASQRRVELAVRSALGAGSGRLVRQLLTESLVLAAAGGALGIALAFGALDLLLGLAPPGTPRLDEVAVDGRVLAFTGVVTVAAALLFGMLPALRVARVDLHDQLREGGRGSLGLGGARLRSALVVGQVALAVVLLVGAGLLARSFQNLRTADLGFETGDRLTMQLSLPPARYPDGEAIRAFLRRLEGELASIPGVRASALTSTLPLTGFDGDVTVNVEGRALPAPGERAGVWYRRVSASYLGTMGIDVVRGRGLTDGDGPDDPPVVVVNETLAARMFAGEEAVGRRINFNDPAEPVWREIVGVARDIRNFGIREGSRMAMYVPTAQSAGRVYFPVLEVEGDPEPVVAAVRARVAGLDPSLPLARIRTMEAIVRDTVAPERFLATLLGLFAAVATALAVVGLYGVMAYAVGSRIGEMGVRMALGAGQGRISREVLGRSLVLVAVGLALGLALAVAAGHLVGSLLFGVPPTDPVTFVAVPAVLAVAALAAAAVPAVRAARVDPAVALRGE